MALVRLHKTVGVKVGRVQVGGGAQVALVLLLELVEGLAPLLLGQRQLGGEPRRIAPGERIAQLVVARVARADWRMVEPGSDEQRSLAGGRVETARGSGGVCSGVS